MRRQLEKFLAICGALLISLSIASCASEGVTRAMSGPPRVQTDIFPGGSSSFSMGPFQKKENFVNVERAQWNFSAGRSGRFWGDIQPSIYPVATLNILQSYRPLDVRWKLKDGREFFLDDVDIRSISNDFLRKYPIQLQWQREGRPREKVGDGDPVLCFEIRNDELILKWIVRINNTPPNQRLTANGAATRWEIQHEETLVTTIKGNRIVGINFNTTYEPPK
jgi:hypothetical protein